MQRLTSTILAVCCLTYFSFGQQDSAPPLPIERVRQKEPSVDPAKHHLAEDKAQVIRSKQVCRQYAAPSVYCDEAQLARMDNGSYFNCHNRSGKHTFARMTSSQGRNPILKAGKRFPAG